MQTFSIDTINNHPRFIVHKLIELYGNEMIFEFSYYSYKRDTIEDIRSVFTVDAKNVDDDYLVNICKATPLGHNLAFHSTVYFKNGDIKHIPMVDLATRGIGVISKVLNVLPSELASQMVWYESGRSFHGYGTFLIQQDAWVKLMGRFLLVNQPQQHAVVDPRWIGHRLIAGYSALRWTKNTEDYIQVPKLVKNIHLIHQK